MRWGRFEHDGRPSYGLVDAEWIEPVEGDPFGEFTASGERIRLDQVKLLVPLVPKTFYAAGLNYVRHVKEAVELLGRELDVPGKPDIGYRANNALIAHDEDVVIPKDATDKVQYEAELVVVIGRRAKHLSEADALSCVLGYTVGNDVSERSWQKEDRTLWRAKNTDTFKPIGPWIETDVTLEDLETTVRVNGEVKTTFATNDMLFGVARYISAMTRYLTLQPGDMIWMGTDGTSPDLVDGDVVEVEIDPIGTLRNRFIREQ